MLVQHLYTTSRRYCASSWCQLSCIRRWHSTLCLLWPIQSARTGKCTYCTAKLIKDIKIWMNVNKLKLNESKTEFFVAASPYYEKRLPEITLTIGNSRIKPSQTIRNLGAYFDSNMTMASHITNVSRTIIFHLRNISRIRRYIDKDTCHHAVSSLILSRIDYCNGLLSSLPKSYTLRLQRLQKWAARLVFTVNRQQDPKTTA